MAKPKRTAKSKKKLSSKKKSPAKKAAKKLNAKRKSKKVLPIPNGYHSITPYLIVNQRVKAIEFYKKAFGAKEMFRVEREGGKIGHAELRIGDARIMLADVCPEKGGRSPEECNGTSISIYLYIKNVDDVVKRAISAGAILDKPVESMFWGDRCGVLKDPYGHLWCVSTHVEDVTPAQVKKRATELFGKK